MQWKQVRELRVDEFMKFMLDVERFVMTRQVTNGSDTIQVEVVRPKWPTTSIRPSG